jgi:hypothetical protein
MRRSIQPVRRLCCARTPPSSIGLFRGLATKAEDDAPPSAAAPAAAPAAAAPAAPPDWERWARLVPSCVLMNVAGSAFAQGPLIMPELARHFGVVAAASGDWSTAAARMPRS